MNEKTNQRPRSEIEAMLANAAEGLESVPLVMIVKTFAALRDRLDEFDSVLAEVPARMHDREYNPHGHLKLVLEHKISFAGHGLMADMAALLQKASGIVALAGMAEGAKIEANNKA